MQVPINASLTNLPADYATVYNGEIPANLTSLAQLFGAISVNLEKNSAATLSSVLSQWPSNKPIIVNARGHAFVNAVC